MKSYAPSPASPTDTEIIARRLRETMKSRGLSSVQLARMAGLKTSFLYDILRYKSHNPSIIRLARVAEILDIPLTYLTGGESFNALNYAQPLSDDRVMVPSIVSLKNQAAPNTPLTFSRQWLYENFGPIENLRLFSMPDNTMHPTLCKQDTLLVDTSETALKRENVFVIRHKNKLTARRMRYTQKTRGTVEIICDQPTRLPEKCSSADIAIAGRVVWVSRLI